MTLPRRILPGTSYVVARRCTERRFHFTPTAALVRDFKYVLACAADTFDIELHAVVFMSNHYHLWLTDTSGLLPKFMHTLNRNLARVVKSHYPDIEGEVFDRQPYNALMILGQAAATAELAYLLANPVKARLVERHDEWPGLITTGAMLAEVLARGGVEETVPRPVKTLRTLPPQATYRITLYRPHSLYGAEHRNEAARFMGEILKGALDEVEAQESALAEARRFSGCKVLGRARLARQSHLERPRSPELSQQCAQQLGTSQSKTLAPSRYDTFQRIKPALVARCKDLMRTASAVLNAWRTAYRKARSEMQRGLKGVCLPAGTWWLKEQRLAQCETVPQGADPVALCLSLG